MIPLFVLLGAFLISVVISRFIRNGYDLAASGRIAMAIMLCFTAVAHFGYTEGMVMMVPDAVRFKKLTVYLTGVLELVFAFFLISGRYQKLTGWMLIAFFLMMLPANIRAAIQHIDYRTASFDGPGPAYLWFRIPLQLFFISWAYVTCIKTRGRPAGKRYKMREL